MKIHCIVNPASGQDQPVLAVLNREFKNACVDWSVHVTQSSEDTRLAVERGVKDCDMIAVYGGDGTVSEVANAMLNSPLPLAILPGGTGNVIAQELSIPLELSAAVQLACSPSATRVAIDAIWLRDRAYFLRVGVGAEAAAIIGASRERKDELGWFGYVLGTLDAIREVQPIDFRWQIDGHPLAGRAVACMIANIGRIGRGGLRFAESIKPTDGKLDVLIVRDAQLMTAGAMTASAFGAEPDLSDVRDGFTDAPFQRFQCERITVETLADALVHGDGDQIDAPPLDVQIKPACLKVVLPQDHIL